MLNCNNCTVWLLSFVSWKQRIVYNTTIISVVLVINNQKELFVDYVKTKPQLLSGKPVILHKRHHKLPTSLTSNPGVSKDWKGWLEININSNDIIRISKLSDIKLWFLFQSNTWYFYWVFSYRTFKLLNKPL